MRQDPRISIIKDMAAEYHPHAIARITGINYSFVYSAVDKHQIPVLSLSEATAPTQGEWIGVVNECAAAAGIEPSAILGGSRHRPVGRARWQAFKTLLDRYPNYSIAGLARTSGFHHSSILYGLSRFAGTTPKSARIGNSSRVSGRKPLHLRAA